jgi:predicted CXXCH cytochrome family protein
VGRSRSFLMLSAGTACLVTALAASSSPAEQPLPASPLSILYPKHQAAVGRRVNIVIDPATDWSTIPYLQVIVGSTEYPLVDTSGGRHAVQGVALSAGLNAITVRALARVSGKTHRNGGAGVPEGYLVLASRTVAVYNREGSFDALPSSFAPQYFHTRENEEICAACHRLAVETQDRQPKKPEGVLCYGCHREIPSGKRIHGPAAVWNCLACHDPDLSPVKYQFASVDPWRVTKASDPVEPAFFTLPAASLFKEKSAALASEGRVLPRLKEFLEYARQHPADRIRVEVHADASPLPKGGRSGRFRDHRHLAAARAKALEKLLRTYGISGKSRVQVVGMGGVQPKVTDAAGAERDLNDRIEIIVAPAEMPGTIGRSPAAARPDLLRVLVNIAYLKGPASGSVRDLKVTERLPAGMKYVSGSGTYRNKVLDPRVSGNELVWTLGNPVGAFQERLTYLVRAAAGASATAEPGLRLSYVAGGRTVVHDIDPRIPREGGTTIAVVCQRCHGDMLGGAYRHGPAAAGYCTLCHDPHGSDHDAWTRKQSWQLCTTCHEEKKKGVHLFAGFVYDITHPTNKFPDPSRPGKRLSCISCHSPHSADTPALLTYGARNKFDLCKVCHPKK